MLNDYCPWGWRKKSKESVAAFLASRDVRFSQFHIEALKISTPRYEYITSLRFHKLRSSLRSEEVLPIEAVRAFGLKIKEIHEKCNVLIDVLVDAFARAEILQRDFQGKDKPPLYGMPFSVKGNFFLEGHDCTIGFPKFLNMPKDETCSMVSTLIELGGIPICVTNVPQGLMSFSCSNPLYGTTLNPTLTVPHTCGGSSGGEACLVAAGGIPFGTGSDLAGSLRIPAAFCGVVSLKPTEDRLNITGTHGGIPGKFRLSLSFGFFTKTVEEHIELYDIYLNSAAHMRYSPASSPLPFNIRQRQMQRKFKIGYYMNNGFLQPAPACQRVVEETLNNLVMYGHQIEAFDIPEPTLMARLVLQNVMPDGGTYMKNLFSNDIVDVNMGSFINLLKIPNFLRKWASYLIGFVSPHLAQMCRVRLDSVDDVRHMHETTDNYRRKFIKHFTDLQLDAIICPAFPVHAVDSKWPSKLSVCAVETALYNMLNMPAGVVPVSKVTPSDIEMCSNPKAFNQDCLWNGRYNPILWDMKAACDSMDHVGAPLAVQVVTLPYQEEICLLVMKEIERVKKILEEKSWHSSVSSQQSAVAPSRRPSAHSVLYQSSS